MDIKVNRFVIEYLNEYGICKNRFKEGEVLKVPDEGYMEEFSAINRGNNLCQMGSASYSNAVIPRLDIKMGRYCSIAVGLGFIAGKHPLHTFTTSSCFYDPYFYIFKDSFYKFSGKPYDFCKDWSLGHKLVPPPSPTILENDVYVCTNALLKPGITLHTGCVVAQNAIVTKDVPPYAVVGGSPARILKYRFDEKTIARLLRLKWWEYHFSSFRGIDVLQDINSYLDEVEKRIENQEILPFKPRKMQFAELIERSKQKENTAALQPISTQNQVENKDEIIKNLKEQICKKEAEFHRADKENENLKKRVSSQDLQLQFILKYGTAKQRIQNQLSYKLGQAMIKNSKSLFGYVKMPFILNSIANQHKKEQKVYQTKISRNPILKLPSLEKYPDYQESLRYKEHLSYQLGNALIEASRRGIMGGGGAFGCCLKQYI